MLHWKDVLYYAKYSNPEPDKKVIKTEAQWRQELTSAQYHVMREKGTEPAYRNAYCRSFEPGLYICAACRSPLFDSNQKSRKMSGWPSFTQPIAKRAIKCQFDDSHGMNRIEVLCNVCDCHLGHVFQDGVDSTELKYCINSECLKRINKEEK